MQENLREIDLRKLFFTLFPGIDSSGSLVLCPFHADRNPSLNPAYTAGDGRQRWHCYGCSAGGDAIDLVQAAARLGGEELSFPEALGRLSELAGIELGPSSAVYQARRLRRERLQKVADYFKGCLQSHSTGERARGWLIERGIPQETRERLPVGIYPPWEKIKAWARGQEIPLDWLKEEKLWVGAAQGGEKWTGALAFFYGLSFNEISRIKLRIPREKGPGSMTWLGKKGQEIGFFGLSSYDPRKSDGRVLLVEGEFDLLVPWALAIREKGLIPPIFCRSGGAAKGDRTYKILADLSVQAIYALPDNDPAGVEWAERAIRGAEAADLPVMISWPEDYRPGEDPADLCLRLASIEAFQEAMAQALLPWCWVARRIIAGSDNSPEGIQQARRRVRSYARKLTGTARGDFLEEVAPFLQARSQDLFDDLSGDRKPDEERSTGLAPKLAQARQVLSKIQTAEHIQAALESPELLSGVALVARLDRGTYEAALMRLRDLGVRDREIKALEKAVNAGLQREKRSRRQAGAGEEGLSAPPLVGDFLPETPFANGLVVPRGWQITGEGVFRVDLVEDAGFLLHGIAPTPILITGRLKDVIEGTESVRLSWERDGQWQHTVADRAVVANLKKIVDLADLGLTVTTGTAKDLVDYLAAFEAANLKGLSRAMVSRQMGWQGPEGKKGFLWGRTLIRPDGSIAESPEPFGFTSSDGWGEAGIAFHGADAGEEQIADGFHAQGSFEEWKLSAYLVSSYPRAMLALYVALSPPLLTILDTPNFTIDWSYVTSTGKTTCLRLATSCWGNPDERKRSAAMGSWDATRVWVERASGVLNGLPLILDDTKRARRPQDIAQTLYDVSFGRGRGRGSLRGTRQAGSWTTILLSTGEAPIDSFTQSEGGNRARVVKVWGMPFGRADDTTTLIVRDLNRAIRQHYGHAGPRFVQFLLRNRDQWKAWRKELSALQKRYSAQAGPNPVADRIVEHLAMITLTARLAHEALELPWEYRDPIAPLWKDLLGEVSEADRASRALEYVVSWAYAHESEFWGRNRLDRDGTPLQPLPGWAGKWDKEESWDTIAFHPHKLRELLAQAGFESEPTLRLWQDRGWLETGGDRSRHGKQVWIDGKSPWCVVIRRSATEQVGG